MTPAIVGSSAAEIAGRVGRKEWSPLEVVEAHIAQIERVNPWVNAVVTTTFDRARADARALGDALARGHDGGPLAGVPFTVKDCLDTEGARSTSGLTSRRDHVARSDAVVVNRLREAGAILLGKTNCPDACWGGETENLLFGRTRHPRDPSRTVGGSSGGSAAIVAAEGAAFDIGSDIGGSIRVPAVYTGVVGLRATSGSIPEDGMWPPLTGRLADLESLGPLARSVADAALVLDVIRGQPHEPPDVSCLSGARVAHWHSAGLARCHPAVRAAIDASVKALVNAGMVSANGAPRARHFATLGWSAYMGRSEMNQMARAFGGGTAYSPTTELLRWARGAPRVTPSALLTWLSSIAGSVVMHPFVPAGAWRDRLRAELFALVGEGGVAICPVRPAPAPRSSWYTRTVDYLVTMDFHSWVNLAGLPAMSVPTGEVDGMPIGVQVVGNPGGERAVLAAGLVIERANRAR
jgi:Asp-tRNA(Asn)/Glu-tRNA(Gln) amidotransferase A subunit family amidase